MVLSGRLQAPTAAVFILAARKAGGAASSIITTLSARSAVKFSRGAGELVFEVLKCVCHHLLQ